MCSRPQGSRHARWVRWARSASGAAQAQPAPDGAEARQSPRPGGRRATDCERRLVAERTWLSPGWGGSTVVSLGRLRPNKSADDIHNMGTERGTCKGLCDLEGRPWGRLLADLLPGAQVR